MDGAHHDPAAQPIANMSDEIVGGVGQAPREEPERPSEQVPEATQLLEHTRHGPRFDRMPAAPVNQYDGVAAPVAGNALQSLRCGVALQRAKRRRPCGSSADASLTVA
jgi:hypothetical protein